MERRRLSELLTEPPNSMPMPQRSVGFNICKAMGGRPQGPQLCRENHSGGWASLRVQWVPGPFVQMLQPAHPPTELSLPTRYHRWSEANTKSLAPKEPCRVGSSLLASRAAQQAQGAQPREVCSGKVKSTGSGSGMYSSSPRVAIYVCPRASDTPHSTPLSQSCFEGPVREINSWVQSSEGQLWGYGSPPSPGMACVTKGGGTDIISEVS